MFQQMIMSCIVVAAACFPALVNAADGDALPLRHGIYVDVGTECGAAQNATTISYWGDQLNSAHVVGHIRNVVERNGSFLVTLHREGDAGMGGNLRDQIIEETITTDGPETLSIENDFGTFSYRWCAATMNDLSRMRHQQAQTPPPMADEPASLEFPAAAPFFGTWGLSDGSADACGDHNTVVYRDGEIETMHLHVTYDSDGVSEVSPGHWRIEGEQVYESQRFPLTYDLYVDGEHMRQVITASDGG